MRLDWGLELLLALLVSPQLIVDAPAVVVVVVVIVGCGPTARCPQPQGRCRRMEETPAGPLG